MAPEDRNLPAFLNNPCHNCRRRRLRCDRSRPSCFKCTNSGRECLGYDRLFIWTDGGGAGGGSGAGAGAGAAGPSSRGRKTERASSEASDVSLSLSLSTATAISGSARSYQASPRGWESERSEKRERRASELSICSPTTLTDPIFQDLDRLSRHYLAHFADRVCQDLVAHDGPASNPFRELVPLAMEHPFLLHILVATSAIHMSNISHPKIPASASISASASDTASASASDSASASASASTSAAPSSPSAALLVNTGGRLQYLRSTTELSRSCFLDALAAKQQAIQHLRIALEQPDTDGDVVLAAVLFFVNFELIDFGKSSWKTHLHGASKIMSLLTPDADGGPCKPGRLLRDCIVSDFVIYHILGSTLTSAGLAASIANHALNLLPVLERVEANSYLCCPPAILSIILSASQLSAEASTPETATAALHLIHAALSFDIPAWALAIQSHSSVPDLPSREHVASAHRSAVVLYILRAIPSVRDISPVTVDFLLSDIVTRLSLVDESDPHFKATSWPTFIAGAEARQPEWRAWALARLLSVWECCPWGYVVTAVDMLKETWKARDGDGGGSLREVWDLDFDCLVV